MRFLAVLGACVVATAAITQEHVASTFNLDSPDAVVAQDFAEEPIETGFRYAPPDKDNGNGTADDVSVLVNRVLSAYEEDTPTPQCSSGPVDVLILVSSCFTPAEITTILSPIDNAMTDGSMTFYHDDGEITVRPSFGIYYYDCQKTLNVPNFQNVPQIYFPTHRNLFVAISKGKESSFSKAFTLTGVKMAHTLQIRTCSNRKCGVGRDDLIVPSPASVIDSISSIRDAMFCAASTNPPTFYKDEHNNRQCECGCPAPFSIHNGVCKCPSDQNVVNNACKCPTSGQSLINEACTCMGDLISRQGSCQCPEGQLRDGNNNQCRSQHTAKPSEPHTPNQPQKPNEPHTPSELQNPNEPETPSEPKSEPKSEPQNPNEPETPSEPKSEPKSKPQNPNKPETPNEPQSEPQAPSEPQIDLQTPNEPESHCVGGRVEELDGSCVCPPDQEVGNNGVCVDKCFWETGNAGYKCEWSSRAKSSLSLNGDCGVDAPVVSDVYVGDRRTNKYDTSLRLEDPMIELGSTPRGTSTSSTHQTTWFSYETTPRSLEDSVTFDTFGVYDLSMVMTNYRKRATCYGCIAVVDSFQPTAIEACHAAGFVSVDYSPSSLGATMNAEAAFKGFYAGSNVEDNGASDAATGPTFGATDNPRKCKTFSPVVTAR